MHRDGILHVKEEAIKQTAIRMGLNQKPLNELKKMENAPNVIIPADLLLKILEKSVIKSTVLVIFLYHHVVLRLA
jgi:hypothetical protein